jgi:transposase
MKKNTEILVHPKASGDGLAGLVTRGLARAQEKRRRLRARVGDPLIVGVDLAREHQAISYHAGEIVGRRRLRCAPAELCERVLEEAEALRRKHGKDRVLFAMEPAGHYWGLLAERIEEQGSDYVLVHTLAVKREREATRFTPEKRDPRDADLICELVASGKILEARLFSSRFEAQLNAYAREYLLVRRACAAEKTRLVNFWDRLLPEFAEVLREVNSRTAVCIARALTDFTSLSSLSLAQWEERVRAVAAGKRIQVSRVRRLWPRIQAAHAAPHRRMTDALPLRIRQAAERWTLLDEQKRSLAEEILRLYEQRPEAAHLDSIPGSLQIYNALLLGLVGDFRLYDDPRALVKLAGSEVNEYASGNYRGRSRISHRGRNPLRNVAYQQARQLIQKNEDFARRFVHLRTRTGEPRLLDPQARVAVANSYLRTAHVLVTQNQLYVPLAERLAQRVAMI